MYGFPLSIYVFSGWLATRYPGIDFLSHDNGHLIHTLLGMKGNPHWDIFHILSNIFIFGGFVLQWPTLPTLVMFPVLTFMYVRLSLREEKIAEAEFGDGYRRYMRDVPGFIPRLGGPKHKRA